MTGSQPERVLIPGDVIPGLRVAADVAMQTSGLVAKDKDLALEVRFAVATAFSNFSATLLKLIDATEDDEIAALMRPALPPGPAPIYRAMLRQAVAEAEKGRET